MTLSLLGMAFVRWVHLFGAVVWLGGLFFYLMVLLPALKDLDPGQARRLSQLVSLRFRVVSIVCLFALLFSGLWLVSQILQGLSLAEWFFSSTYSKALGLKILVALIAMTDGIVLGFILSPRLVDALEARDEPKALAIGRTMGLLSGVNFLLGLVITGCVAVLRLYS